MIVLSGGAEEKTTFNFSVFETNEALDLLIKIVVVVKLFKYK